MRRTIVRILVLIVACLGGACTSVLAQEHSIKMSFLDNVGSDFALLLMGSREGEVSLVWEDGSVEKHTLHTTATAIRGKTKSKNLELRGDIAVMAWACWMSRICLRLPTSFRERISSRN